MSTPSITSQIAAAKAILAIALDGKPKPKGSQLDLLRELVAAAIETLEAVKHSGSGQ